jgi:hypothetical protein
MIKGYSQEFALAKSCLDLLSDHSPVWITLKAHAVNQEKQPSLSNRRTNWNDFRQLISERLTSNVSLKTEEDIDAAVKFFNDTIQWAGWNAIPEHTGTLKTYDSPILTKQEIEEKIILRRGWHRLWTPESKRLLNIATQELKQLPSSNKNDSIQTFLQGLTTTESTDYFLWKATKKMKRGKKPSPPLRTLQRIWARSNVEKSTRFHWTISKSFWAASLRKWNRRRKNTYITSGGPLPTRTTNRPFQKSWSSRSQQPKS